jgi:mannosyltransferase
MARRRKKSAYAETQNKPASASTVPSSDLDGGYVSPIQSYRDLTVENIKNVLLNSRYAQIIVILTAIGAFLRFYNLGFNSIWLDEASTYLFSRGSFQEIWQFMLAGDYNPPLFQFFEHFMLMFGNSEITLRFVPALAGVLTIPVMYLVGKEFIDRNAGLIAATATTISPFLIFYSQEARAYTLTLFFVAVEFYFYLKSTSSNDTKDWALFGLFAALSFWTHFYTLVITALLFIFSIVMNIRTIIEDIRSLKNLIVAAVVLIVTTLPLIIVIVPLYLKRTASAPTYGVQGAGIVSQTLVQLLGFNEFVMLVLLLLLGIGIVWLYISDHKKALLLLWILTASFAVSTFMSYRIPMLPRYLIFLSIFLFVGIAGSYKVLYAVTDSKYSPYILIAALFITSLTFIPSYYTNSSKDDWRGFSVTLTSVTKPGDTVVLVPGYNSQPLDYYYSNVSDGTIELNNISATAGAFSAIPSPPSGNTVYFVVTGDISAANPEGDATAWLQQNTNQVTNNGGIFLLAGKPL